jgi:hypothetical protein
LNIISMVVYTCKKCGELSYLTPHAFWNIDDFDSKGERCETINTITLVMGELKKQVWSVGKIGTDMEELTQLRPLYLWDLWDVYLFGSQVLC